MEYLDVENSISSPSKKPASGDSRFGENEALYFWLKKVRVGHDFYLIASEYEQGEIIRKFEESVFPEIINKGISGIESSFCILYLLYGNDFINKEFGVNTLEGFIKTL